MKRLTLDNFLGAVVGIAAVLGVGLIVLPAHLLWLLGLAPDAAGAFVARELGAALIGLAIIFWAVRDPWDLSRQALAGGLVFNALGLVIALAAVWSGVLSAAGWLVVALHLLLAAGFAWFRRGQ